jgi:hypothetical protein
MRSNSSGPQTLPPSAKLTLLLWFRRRTASTDAEAVAQTILGQRGGPLKTGLYFLLLSLATVSSSAAQSTKSDAPEANPGRPTVSTHRH